MRKNKGKRKINKVLAALGVITVLCAAPVVQTYAAGNSSVDMKTAKSGSSNVTIDGYYDDWVDKPMTVFTYGSNNGKTSNRVSMIKDEEYIYIYMEVHPSYERSDPAILINSINLSINDRTCPMFIRYATPQNTIDWSYIPFKNNQIYTGLHPFTYYPTNSLGDAALTATHGNPNEKAEVRINIKDLEKAMDLKAGTINSGSKISLQLPNLGSQKLDLLGTSTGAVVGILLCIGVVIGVMYYRRKKMRLSQ